MSPIYLSVYLPTYSPTYLATYLPTYLVISHITTAHEYVFYTSGCNPILLYLLLYFIAQILPALATGNTFSWLLEAFNISPSYGLFCF